MKVENRKEILLALLHTYTLSVRHCCPGESDREMYHRLVDTTNLTGHHIFEKRNDGRHFIANVPTGDGPKRVLTVFNDPKTGKLDLDLTTPFDDGMEEDIFMLLYKILTIAFGVTAGELVSHTKTHQSKLALAIAAKAVEAA